MFNLQLEGKSALVTGSTQGIGYAIATSLIQQGVEVTIHGRTQQEVDVAITKLQAKFAHKAIQGVAADFSDPTSIEKIITVLPQADILINNASEYKYMPFSEITNQNWQYLLSVNVIAGSLLAQHYLNNMLKENFGRIIFIASEAGINVPPIMIQYGTTKAAQMSLAYGIAQLTKGTAVTVNSILPGLTDTEGLHEYLTTIPELQNVSIAEFLQLATPGSLLGRLSAPEEIAHVATFLSSPLASAINGTALQAAGGCIKACR